MHNKDILIEYLKDMEDFAKMKNIDCPPIYLLGGSGCILGGYIQRATTDFDLIDTGYSSSTGRVLKILEDYDLLDYYVTPLAEDFRERAIRLEQFNYLKIFVLSKEDIIVSKLSRFADKDIEDIRKLLEDANIDIVLSLIQKVIERKDFSPKVKAYFTANISKFKEKFNV